MDMWLVTVNTHFFHNDAVHPVSSTGMVERPSKKYPDFVDLVVVPDFYQEVPRWEQLYNSAPLKEAFMGSITVIELGMVQTHLPTKFNGAIMDSYHHV